MRERSGLVEGGGVERAGAGEGRKQKTRGRKMNRIAKIQTVGVTAVAERWCQGQHIAASC